MSIDTTQKPEIDEAQTPYQIEPTTFNKNESPEGLEEPESLKEDETDSDLSEDDDLDDEDDIELEDEDDLDMEDEGYDPADPDFDPDERVDQGGRMPSSGAGI
jgi:ribonuclease E